MGAGHRGALGGAAPEVVEVGSGTEKGHVLLHLKTVQYVNPVHYAREKVHRLRSVT